MMTQMLYQGIKKFLFFLKQLQIQADIWQNKLSLAVLEKHLRTTFAIMENPYIGT